MRKTRKKPADARMAILEVAQTYLIEGGPDAVKVQKIARDLGITDAAIHYHFKNRQNLLEALLKHAGRQLKQSLTQSVEARSVSDIARQLDEVYRQQGLANLAMWLSFAGSQDEGRGMFNDLVQQCHRDKTPLQETQFCIAMLNLICAAEPLMGEAFLRSVGLSGDDESRQQFRCWMTEKMDPLLD